MTEVLSDLPRGVDADAATVLVGLCPLGLLILGGPVGGVVGLAAAVLWVHSPVYGFAVGQLGLVLVVEQPVAPGRLAALQAAVFLVLLAGLLRGKSSHRPPLAFVVLALVLGGGVVAGIDAGLGTPTLAGILVVAIGIASYLLHRYERVALGLVGESITGGSR